MSFSFLSCQMQASIPFTSLLRVSPHVQVVHGAHDTVNFMCDSPVIKAISFVGSNAAGEHVYERGTRQGKRVQVRTNLAH